MHQNKVKSPSANCTPISNEIKIPLRQASLAQATNRLTNSNGDKLLAYTNSLTRELAETGALNWR
jgi:hypothetical protein